MEIAIADILIANFGFSTYKIFNTRVVAINILG